MPTAIDQAMMEAEGQRQLPPNVGEGYRNDPSLSPQGPYLHGNGGIFNHMGAHVGVFSALMLPVGGAMDAIPVINEDPADSADAGGSALFGGEMVALDSLLTGVTSGPADSFANQPTTDCADGPVGGLTKICSQVNPFGRFRVGVREVSMFRAGQRQDFLDPRSVRLMNSPIMQNFLGVPSNVPNTRNAMINEIGHRMWESAISFRRMFARRVWIGSPANNSGERRDIMGLDIHINSGNKIDFQSSSICTAANSLVMNFGKQRVDAAGGRSIVEYMETADYNQIDWKGSHQGLTPIDGWVFMRPEMWRSVSAYWPIKQFEQAMNNIQAYANGRVVVSANEALNERNTFRANHVLPINGRNYQVVEDDTMPFDTSNEDGALIPGEYMSDIVFVPRSVMGGIPVTFWQMYNHANQQEDAIQNLAGGGVTFTTDGGRFRFYVNFKNGCMNMTWEFSPRLKVKTPQIGWRINDVVAYSPFHVTDWDPNSSYFADGGVTGRPSETYYTPWSPTTPVAIP